ncbi:MAG: glutathione peroxidase [Lentisphaeria bacterium]|nr:glutathione peroxidase [Lentisphaeria bacterium]
MFKSIFGVIGLVLFGSQVVLADDGKYVLDFKVLDKSGKEVSLESYKGKVILIVNVASRCGLTGQYAGLQEIFTKYENQGFVILAFPANNFGGQEPGSNEQIQQFCQRNYGVTFPVMAKISVKGNDIAPLYKQLTEQDNEFKGVIKWNFEKFIIGRDGQLVGRFAPRVKPKDPVLLQTIESELKK